MKLPYTADHARRETVPLRVRKDYADLLGELAHERHVTKSKLLDKLFEYGLGWLKEKSEFTENRSAEN
jgi:hypothetical protein